MLNFGASLQQASVSYLGMLVLCSRSVSGSQPEREAGAPK